MYAQIEVSNNYPFTKTEKNNIEKIKKIVKYGKIDNYILFNEGLYLSSVAGIILGKTRIQIAKKYETLPIKSRKDLEITTNEIESILSINKNQLKDIIDTLINLILNNKLKNRCIFLVYIYLSILSIRWIFSKKKLPIYWKFW